MIIQILDLSPKEVFKEYSNIYRIFRDAYQPGLTGLELRNIPPALAETVRNVVLNENSICYKSGKDEGDINLFIPGSISGFKELSRRILSSGDEDLGYKISHVIKNFDEYDRKKFTIGKKNFRMDKVHLMGILNVTPDSFSDGEMYRNHQDAVRHAVEMIDKGADIIDIGGESTRPGSDAVSAEEEISRVVPVIEAILKEKPEAIISVDTTKSKVAEEALKLGASIINDISALTFDENLAGVVKKYNAALILMHMRGTPKDMQKEIYYDNLIENIYDFLSERISFAAKAGIKNIIADPGIGFGKKHSQNFEIIKRLADFKSLGAPLLIGLSRKGFLGTLLNLDVKDRDAATAIAETASIRNGARIIRTHNVDYGVQVCKIMNNLI